MKQQIKVIAFALCGIGFAANAANVPVELVNAGFEQVDKDGYPVGWRKHKDWHGERCGHNGSGGIVFERHATTLGKKGGRPSQKIKVEAGKRYYFSALVKTENIVTDRKSPAKGVTLHLEAYNEKGKWQFGRFAAPAVSGTSKAWVKVEGITPKMPEGIKDAYIQPIANGCISGIGVVDNVFVAAIENLPVGGVFSDVYRNESTGGKVKFFASLDVDCSKVMLEEHSVEFSYVKSDGRRCVVPGKLHSCSDASIELDTGNFAYGTNDVVCALLQNGKEIGSASLKFARLARPTPRKVYIGKNRLAIVDGKPFFPLGMYYSAGLVCQSNLNRYTEGPFNCIMPYSSRLKTEQMDLCHSMGLKVMFDLRIGLNDPDAGRAPLAEKIAMHKNHPALLAWYTNDERPVSDIPKLKLRQQWVEELDKDHPTWSVQDVFYETRHYLGSYDVLGMDPYPVPKKPIETVISSMRQGKAGTFGTKAVWQVPQAFGWGWLGRRERAGERGPTKEEIANMTWQSIAGGANGIIYYALHTMRKASAIPGDDFEKAWKRVKSAAAEVKKYEPVLLSLETPPEVSGGTDAVAVRTWRHGGYVYLMAVNCTAMQQSATVTVDAKTSKGVEADFGAMPEIKGGKIDFSFGPLGYVMLKLRQ
jgi:hypothetical protein